MLEIRGQEIRGKLGGLARDITALRPGCFPRVVFVCARARACGGASLDACPSDQKETVKMSICPNPDLEAKRKLPPPWSRKT